MANKSPKQSGSESGHKNLPWWQPEIGAGEHSLVEQVLRSHYINEGDVVAHFEKRLTELLGCKHAVTCTSGTAALFLALAALDIGPGDEVIVPDVTFIATANAVTLTGARPVLVDVDARPLTMDPLAVERAITPATRALMPVHVSGRAADMTALLDIARRHKLDIVEDAAEAFLSRYRGSWLGTIGKAGCFSFSPNKIMTTGQGGAVVTNDDRVAGRLRELKDQGRPVRGTGGDDLHKTIGFNFKLTNLQAAVGMAQLDYVPQRLERLRQHYQVYRDELENVAGIDLPGFQIEAGEQPLWVDALIDRRDDVDRYLSGHGCNCRRFWFPIHTQQAYAWPDHLFPNALRSTPKAIWLPSAFQLTQDDVKRVCRHIRDCLTQQGAAKECA